MTTPGDPAPDLRDAHQEGTIDFLDRRAEVPRAVAAGTPIPSTGSRGMNGDERGRGSAASRPVPRSGAPPPAGAGLVAANAPPLRLPLQHFLAALGFLLAGAAGLVSVAPDLARGAFTLPRVAAVAHLFTLGWITTSIQGALYQFLPVALNRSIRYPWLADLSFWLYVPGLVVFIAGLLAGFSAVMLTGAALFGLGLILFVGNLGATLRGAPERNLTWWALVGASVGLVVTVVLGSSLAANLRWGHLGPDRFLAIGVHLHVAIAGWVLPVIIGVGHRLLPMFLLSHGVSERPGRIALAGVIAGTALLLAFHHWLSSGVLWTVAVLLIGGTLAFILQAVLHFRQRKRPGLDPGLRLAAAGVAFLLLALALAPFVLAKGIGAASLATAYVIILVLGALSLFVAGHFYKILPFLIWYHRFGPLVGKREVPRVADLYSHPIANVVAVLLPVGVIGLAGGTLAGSSAVARAAAVVFATGITIMVFQLSSLLRSRSP